jgi:hypothetical protein
MDIGVLCREYGLLGVVIFSVVTMFFFLLKWVLAQFKEELVNNRSERKDYLITLGKIREQIDEHNIRAKEFQCAVSLEHKEMILTLGRINGYTHKGEAGERGPRGERGEHG